VGNDNVQTVPICRGRSQELLIALVEENNGHVGAIVWQIRIYAEDKEDEGQSDQDHVMCHETDRELNRFLVLRKG
jgi:hypothetical protein